MAVNPNDFKPTKVEIGEPDKRAVFGSRKGPLFPRNVFFVGLRGGGKTTLGLRLAGLLGKPFADMDQVVAQRAGKSIAEIVAEGGWEAFRKLESEALRELCAGEGRIIATGGGVVLAEENRKLLAGDCKIFYLHAEPKVLLERLAANPGVEFRPPLSGKTPEDEMAEAYAQRDPLYREVADFVLEADEQIQKLAVQCMEALRKLAQG